MVTMERVQYIQDIVEMYDNSLYSLEYDEEETSMSIDALRYMQQRALNELWLQLNDETP